MLDVSSLIEFLLKLLRDDAAQAEFVRDPQGVLAQAGLSGVTAQDICDAQPILADHSGVAVGASRGGPSAPPTPPGPPRGGGPPPPRRCTTRRRTTTTRRTRSST